MGIRTRDSDLTFFRATLICVSVSNSDLVTTLTPLRKENFRAVSASRVASERGNFARTIVLADFFTFTVGTTNSL